MTPQKGKEEVGVINIFIKNLGHVTHIDDFDWLSN